jgi:uncharacterized membrane protein
MMYHRTITACVAVALIAATTAAAAVRAHAPNPARPELAGLVTIGPKPMPEIKKSVRYEAIISNWKRYRSATKSDG